MTSIAWPAVGMVSPCVAASQKTRGACGAHMLHMVHRLYFTKQSTTKQAFCFLLYFKRTIAYKCSFLVL